MYRSCLQGEQPLCCQSRVGGAGATGAYAANAYEGCVTAGGAGTGAVGTAAYGACPADDTTRSPTCCSGLVRGLFPDCPSYLMYQYLLLYAHC